MASVCHMCGGDGEVEVESLRARVRTSWKIISPCFYGFGRKLEMKYIGKNEAAEEMQPRLRQPGLYSVLSLV